YYLFQSDMTIDMKDNSIEYHNNFAEPWKVTLIDTGLNTMTGGRIKRAKDFIGNSQFMLTYGDGVSDVDISKLLEFHNKQNKLITMTAIQPEGRFGTLDINNRNKITSFLEKPKGDNNWINGGFFVCQPEVLDYIEGDSTIFERTPLQTLATKGELMAFPHNGFWQCMDTQREKNKLNELWNSNTAPWKVWN
ncbi:MAG: sugar phosphate nucleotidyltransferase, partial [Lentisphaerota bacterium]